MGKTVACEGYGLNCVHVAPRRPPSYAEVLTSSPSEWDIIGNRVLPHSSVGKNMYLQMQESACNAGDPVQLLDHEDPLEKEMAAHSSIPAWKIPWTEDPGVLQSLG